MAAVKTQKVISDTPSLVVEELRTQFNKVLDVLDSSNSLFGDSTGTPGAATLNTLSGKSKLKATEATLVITNSLVTENSVIVATLAETDATALYAQFITPANGSFTITFNAAATGNPVVRWSIVTPDLSTLVKKVELTKAIPTPRKFPVA
jgi:hypothetical protein